MYTDHIERDFSKYVEKIRKNGEWGGIVESFAFPNMIDVWIELWYDVKDSWIRHLQTLSLIENKINVHFH